MLHRSVEAAPDKRLSKWLLKGYSRQRTESEEPGGDHAQHPWWQVMCLTGVDYFSTLAYQPGIAFVAAGVLSPIASLVLVLMTLFGALPIYRVVSRNSPHGEGSIAMLERLLGWWQGKLFVLVLLGFVATDFIITITLSSADAAAHVRENPFAPHFLDSRQLEITLFSILVLAFVFLRGFKEAVGIAVVLVGLFLSLNLIVVTVGLQEIARNPHLIEDWTRALRNEHGNPLILIGAAIIVFPRLALGLSGFETGVAVMPLVKGDPTDTSRNADGRIRNTHKLLTTAALIMSGFLMTSSFVTTLLIPPAAFEEGGDANGRALSWLAHDRLGEGFGTVYDISTIAILWFAGASALAGLLTIIPRYLPRYGMAPDWTRAMRPLVLVLTAVAIVVTIVFDADVDAQGAAYATGVLVLMASASFAVTLLVRSMGKRNQIIAFTLITIVFIYTMVTNVVERPDGIRIASFFIGAIVITSLISRVTRSTELRVAEVDFDFGAWQLLEETGPEGEIHIIANHADNRDSREYLLKERQERRASNIPTGTPVLFLEITIKDASEFAPTIRVHGERIGRHRVLTAQSASVPNAIAAILLTIRDQTGMHPHVYFGWSEGNPLKYLARFILFGEGDIAPLTHEILRKAEPNARERPSIHVG